MAIFSAELTRRIGATALAALLALGGCGSEGGDAQKVFELAQVAFFGGESESVARETVEQVPYASIGVRFGGAPQAFVVLARQEGDRLTFISADRAVIAIERGRLVQTAGYAFNLDRFEGRDPIRLGDATPGTTSRYLLDLRDLSLFGLPLDCTITERRPDTLTLLGTDFPADRLTEACEARDIGWSFKNAFWIARNSNVVLASVQHFHPRLPALEIQVLRPAR